MTLDTVLREAYLTEQPVDAARLIEGLPNRVLNEYLRKLLAKQTE